MSSVESGVGFGQRRRDVDRDRRRADAALGADERRRPAAGRRRAACRPDAVDRRLELGWRDRLGDALVDAGAHRLEHQRRIERRATMSDAGRRDAGA